jgi:phosphoserine aminotransferase
VRVNVAADARAYSKDGTSYEGIPPHEAYTFTNNPALIYYCENETVNGVQFSKPTTTSGTFLPLALHTSFLIRYYALSPDSR